MVSTSPVVVPPDNVDPTGTVGTPVITDGSFTIEVTGISEDNVTVELLSSGGTQLVTSGDLGTTRTYTISHTESTGGTYSYTVRLTDAAGNTTDYAVSGVVLVVITSSQNLALRATFDDSVYINPDNTVSGTMTGTNGLTVSTDQVIEGTNAGKKLANNTTQFFQISNFISGPWTIVFWYYSKVTDNTDSSDGNWVQVMDQDKYSTSTSWRMYFLTTSNKLGMYYDGSRPTTVTTSSLKDKWTLIAVTSDSYMKVKTADSVIDYYAQLSGLDADASTAGDGIKFGADDTYAPNEDSYYDDIRVYNKVLTNTELNSVFNEHVP